MLSYIYSLPWSNKEKRIQTIRNNKVDLEQKEEHKQITIKDVVEEKRSYENIDLDNRTITNVVNCKLTWTFMIKML